MTPVYRHPNVLPLKNVEFPVANQLARMNVDDNPLTAERFRMQSIPALLILKAGQEIDRIVGVQPKADIVRRLMHAIA